MVLRRGDEVLLLRRVSTMAFAPGMYVFPGGRMAEVDRRFEDPIRACAVRETLEEVSIDVRDCMLFDRWITPEVEERRYDVSFFIADVEESGSLVTTEADALIWMTPQAALARHHVGQLPMLRPTRIVLENLAEGRIAAGSSAVVPKLPRARADGLWDVIDADSGRVLITVDAGPLRSEVDGRMMDT